MEKIISPASLANEKEPADKFVELFHQISEDADLIINPEFLLHLRGIEMDQRIEIAARSAARFYIGPDDFKSYLESYPEDAERIVESLLTDQEIGKNYEAIRWALGTKILEPAARFIGRYDEIVTALQNDEQSTEIPITFLRKSLEISQRSKRVRAHLLGDFKHNFNSGRFDKFGADLSRLTEEVYYSADNAYSALLDRDSIHINQVINSVPYQALDPDNRREFLTALIENANNMQVWQESVNSAFSEEVDGPTGANLHSILYPEKDWGRDYEDNRYLLGDNPYREIIVAAISELEPISDNQTVGFLFDFWDKNKDPIYGPEISTLIANKNPEIGVTEILNRLPSADKLDRKRLISLLFRLELGRIGISAEGLNYIDRKFDLGEYNNSDNFAQRITADGKVGVFDQKRRLQGYIQLESDDFISGQTEVIKKYVLDITVDILFEDNPDETEEDRKQKETIVDELKDKFFDVYINGFPSEAGFRFNNLGLKDQGWALHYLTNSSEESKQRFGKFIDRFGEDGFKAFRSIEFGQDMAEKILQISEDNPELAKNIFEHYSQLIALSQNVAEFVTDNVIEKDVSDDDVKRITIGLLRRGKKLIENFADKPSDSLTQQLQNVRDEIILFAETFKILRKEQEISFEDFKNVSIEVITGQELSDDDRQEMQAIFETNWSGEDKKSIRDAIRIGFINGLNDKNARFHIVRQGKQILTFQRFTNHKNGYVYAASNNVRPEARGSRIGDAAQEAILQKEAEKNVVVASVWVKLPVIEHYLRSSGFVASGIYPDFANSGQPYLAIIIDQKANNLGIYHYQGSKYEKVVSDFKTGAIEKNAQILHLELSEHFAKILEQHFSNDQVCTSYYRDKEKPGYHYLVMEPNQSQAEIEIKDNILEISKKQPEAGENKMPEAKVA